MTRPRGTLLGSRGFGQLEEHVAPYAQRLAEFKDAAARDLLATVSLDGEMSYFAAKFAISVLLFLGFFDIAEHAELAEELASQVLLGQKIYGFGCVIWRRLFKR